MTKLILVLISVVGLLTSCPQPSNDTATDDGYQSAYSPTPVKKIVNKKTGNKMVPLPPSGEALSSSDDKSSYPTYFNTIKNIKSGQLGPIGEGVLAVDSPAPNFWFAMDGKPQALSDNIGKPIMINIFASWCPPCNSEMPDIQNAYENHKRKGLIIVAVSTDSAVSEAKSFYNRYNMTMPFVPGGDKGMAIGDLYNVQAIPTSIFIDRKGIVKEITVGGVDPTELDAKLAKIL